MAFEVTCGHCHGDITIESLGVTVACPLCGSYIEVPDPEAAIETIEGPQAEALAAEPGLAAQTTAEATVVLEEVAEALGPAPDVSPTPAEQPVWQPPTVSAATEVIEAAEVVQSEAALPAEVAEAEAETQPATPREADSALPRLADAAAVVPKKLFIVVASYASAVTLFLLYLLFAMATRRDHPLESLPDLVPQLQGGQVGMKVPRPQENVAPGHVLRLGESQRYGSLKVTPVKITRGPVEIEHMLSKKESSRRLTEPVLKLWLKFENVSSDQTFAPLDRTIVYKRIFKKKSERPFTNNFLCAVDQRHEKGQLYFLYELPEYSEFQISGQDVDRPLKPGETWESFLPSGEGVVDLTGDCVWRVQFRKGYNPQSRRGVTTLIDVLFNTDEIEDETAGQPV